jgi:pantothenate kinase
MSYGKPATEQVLEAPKKSTTRKYVIAFNGPPRVGKDTASNAVCAVIRDRANWLQVRHVQDE